MSTYEPGEQFISEEELKSLLDRWVAPKPSKGLDQRVANSYYTELETADSGTVNAVPPKPKRGSCNEVLFHMQGRIRRQI